MLTRILLAALLVMAAVSVVFQYQNHRLLRDLLVEVRVSSEPSAAPSAPALLVPEPIAPPAEAEPNAAEPPGSAESPTAPPPEPPREESDAAPSGFAPNRSEAPDQAEAEADASEARRERERVVRRIVENLLSGRYDPVVERFDPAMADHLDRDRLAAAMDPIRSEHGPLREIVRIRPVTEGLPEVMSAFRVTAELADGHQLRFTVTLDSEQRISGLLMQ